MWMWPPNTTWATTAPARAFPLERLAPVAGNKIDNFSLNDVDIAFDKAQDESPWAAGYHIDLNAGTDAVGVSLNGTQATVAAGTASAAIRQAYVVVRTPVGNGIDWKVGMQDDIIGYEGNTDGGNPNYTRSIGYSVEPTTLLGMIGSYKIIDAITVQAGIADATSPLLGPTATIGCPPRPTRPLPERLRSRLPTASAGPKAPR